MANVRLADSIQRTVFPYLQGTPDLSAIAGKACALAMVSTAEFKSWAQNVVQNAAALARHLQSREYRVLTGGSDNHMVLIDTLARGFSGFVAEKSLGDCGIIVNKNRIPNDRKGAMTASGLRLGTNTVSVRGMHMEQMAVCAELIDKVLVSTTVLSDRAYRLDSSIRQSVQDDVAELCRRFPIPNYPTFELSHV